MEMEARKFEVLRVSILSHCSFACVYCAPQSKSAETKNRIHFFSPEILISKIKLLLSKVPLKEVHLTGGEPTLHKNLEEIVRGINSLGISEVAITSNGFFEDGLLVRLKKAGLKRINFSIDSHSENNFHKISGRKFPIAQLINRILEAKYLGLIVKLNCTILKGFNETEILDLLTFSGTNQIPIRYLEFMKMGPLHDVHESHFYSASSIRETIASKYKFSSYRTEEDSTATYYITEEGYIFGIIANHTEPFCKGCNRLRMDSFGKIYGCLSDERSFQIPENPNELEVTLEKALMTKKKYFTGSELSMKFIGG